MDNSDSPDYFVGDVAISIRAKLRLSYPIKDCIVTKWDDMEKIWSDAFNRVLRVSPNESKVLLTEAPMNLKKNREKMTTIMFETFQTEAIYISIPAVLSLYSAGKFTGIVCDSGYGVSHFVPIYDGYALPQAINRLEIGGSHVTDNFLQILAELGVHFDPQNEVDAVSSIKEKLCYVSLNFEEEKSNFRQELPFQLPDGKFLNVKTQAIRAPEILFQPSLIGKDQEGFSVLCYKSVMKTAISLRKELFQNIILSGGTSLFEGLPERLAKDVNSFVPEVLKNDVKVFASPDRKYSAWVGGSIYTQLSRYVPGYIT